MSQGTVFNIQKFSVNDGPGIRTTVFLKGCPLRCRWCANPESQLIRPQLLTDRSKCIRCGRCAASCEQSAITMSDQGPVIDLQKCVRCKTCVNGCPKEALRMEGEIRTVDEVIRIVLQDMDFYEESQGGMTLSGGEILTQPVFARDLLIAAHENGIDTCIETTGYADEETFLSILEHTDHVLIDFKQFRPEKHKKGTGITNEKILKNIEHVIESGKDYVIRIPVIPFFNCSEEDAREMAQALADLKAGKVQLLPFHQYGENKYRSLDRPYEYENVDALHPEDLQDILKIFQDAGLNVFI